MNRLLPISFTICLILTGFNLFAQELPNGSFEDIQYITRDFPNGNGTFSYDSISGPWLSGDEIKKDMAIDAGYIFCKDTSWAHHGSHALKMQTMNITNLVATGNVGIGTYEFDDINPFNSVKLGVPFTHRPESLRGYYDYKPVADSVTSENDSCWVAVFFSKWNSTTMERDTIGWGEFVTDQNTNDTYTLFEAPISYSTADTPDTMGLLMCSSKGGYEVFPPVGQVGSRLIVDSCSFVYGSNSIGELANDDFLFITKEDHINLKSSSNQSASVRIYDISGKLIEERALNFGDNKFYLPRKHQSYIFQINGKNFHKNEKVLF